MGLYLAANMGFHDGSTNSTTTQFDIHPSVETRGLPLTTKADLANVGLTAKVVAGNEKVLETSSGLRLPCDPAALDDIKTDAEITRLRRRTNSIERVPAKTNPQFPPLPIYGPLTRPKQIQIQLLRVVSFILSTVFLLSIVCGAVIETIRVNVHTLIHPNERNLDRPLRGLEHQLDREIDEQERKFGKAQLKCDARYYARRVGLDMEEVKVTTEDGFILTLQHLFDPNDTGGRKKYPVLLVHGLLQSAGAFCSNDDNSLAFYLCKSGYDVWLGNNRCFYAPKHMALKSSDPRMWCWNIRQMGVFDLPAFVDHILHVTGFSKLALVAHSQGTTQSFVAMAKDQHPTLGSKISIFCALAPAVYSGPLIKAAHFKFMKLIPAGMFRVVFGIHSFIPFMVTMHSMVPGRLYGWLGYRVFTCILATRNEVEEEEQWMGGSITATAQESDASGQQQHRIESRAVAATRVVSDEGMEKITATTIITTKTSTLERTSHDGAPQVPGNVEGERQQKTAEINVSPRVTSEGQPAIYTPQVSPLRRGGEEANVNSTPHNSRSYPGATPAAASRHECGSRAAPPSSELQLSPQQHPCNGRTPSEQRRERAWFNTSFPPLALWICGSDKLVDGIKLLRRLERGAEPDVNLVHAKVIPAYEHLDCIWAIDSIMQVGAEVKSCIWKSVPWEVRARMSVRTPVGCEGIGVYDPLRRLTDTVPGDDDAGEQVQTAINES
ncbi:hypothetical protein Dda_3331 [Drechslerella dactyloides]|uniref:Partial AB-hydrolase lipase domain-containing protein n=1 Tax=Drechslerella dactyloides TaxID=74499 RepID=A0AAD6J1S0_DREDA|nr:hypothetical protein Dda_3331 [Drechslerella dactyloides]